MDAAVTLTVRELPSSLLLVNRVWDEDQQFSREKGYLKRTRVVEDKASSEITPLLRMSNLFSSRLACALEDATHTVSLSNLAFVQNLSEEEKKEFVYDITHNMYQYNSLFSLVFYGMRDALVSRKPTREMDTWIEKCKAMENKCFTIQEELTTL